MGFFADRKDAGDARSKREGNYISGEGRYVARIEKCRLDQNRKKQTLAFVELTILHRLDPESSHRVGEEVTWCIREDSDYFLPEIMAFIKNTTGEDIDGMDRKGRTDLMAAIFESDNPLGGTFCEFAASKRETKTGATITVTSFKRPVPASEVAGLLDAATIKRFFPKGELEAAVAAEAE